MANRDSEVFTEERDQGMVACGFSFAYAAKRKIAANASRPKISSVRASPPRVSLAVIGWLGYWLKSVSKNCFRIGQVIIPEDAG